MAAVHVRELDVVRGSTHALRAVSLEVPGGRVTGLLGPSGSGKTTLMRAIVGVQVIRSGTVEVLGLPAGAPELRRRIGYVTQAPSVYGDLTARENLDYFARIVEAAPDASRKCSRRSTSSGSLDGRSARSPAASARACRSRPRCSVAPTLLVLDEPTVGLDPVLRRDLWNTFPGSRRPGRRCSSRAT